MLNVISRSLSRKLLQINEPESSSKLRVVIFGGSSQLSPAIGWRLGSLGAQLSFPTRTSSKWIDYLKNTAAYKNVAIPQFIDYNAPGVIDRLIETANVVICIIGSSQHLKDYDFIYDGNVKIPKLIAEAVERNPDVQRFIHFSAVGADPNSPSTRLRTKWIGEQEVRNACPDATIFRPTLIFGELDKFVTRIALTHRMLGWMPVIGDASEKRQPIFHYDVALATMNALRLPESIGKTYELGGPQVYTQKEILEIIFNKIGFPPNLKSFRFNQAHRFMTWMPHAHGLSRHMTLDMVQESQMDLVVSPQALGIEKLFVRPLSFPQNLMRILTDYQAKADLTIEETEHGFNGGNDRYFNP
jgi:uncharacterized protein YbjT (DUF2867 family)